MTTELLIAIKAAHAARISGKEPWEAYDVGKRLLPSLPSGQFERAIQLVAEAAGL